MLLEKIKECSIVVFQDNTSKNQDFFTTFSAPTSNFSPFQVLKNEKSNFRTFSALFKTSENPDYYSNNITNNLAVTLRT